MRRFGYANSLFRKNGCEIQILVLRPPMVIEERENGGIETGNLPFEVIREVLLSNRD